MEIITLDKRLLHTFSVCMYDCGIVVKAIVLNHNVLISFCSSLLLLLTEHCCDCVYYPGHNVHVSNPHPERLE